MKMLTRLLGLALLPLLLASNAYAADQNSTYFSMSSGLVMVGFSDAACGKYPTPWATLDGEKNCSKVPNTFLYKLEKNDGTVVKEVKELTASWDSKTTTTTTVNGQPVTIEDSMKIRDGRSVFGSFGVRNNWSLSDLTGVFGKAESAAERARFFATGLSAVRTSEGGSDYLSKANSLLPSNGQ